VSVYEIYICIGCLHVMLLDSYGCLENLPVKDTIYLDINEKFLIFSTPFIRCGRISVDEIRTKSTEFLRFS